MTRNRSNPDLTVSKETTINDQVESCLENSFTIKNVPKGASPTQYISLSLADQFSKTAATIIGSIRTGVLTSRGFTDRKSSRAWMNPSVL